VESLISGAVGIALGVALVLFVLSPVEQAFYRLLDRRAHRHTDARPFCEQADAYYQHEQREQHSEC
jgi:hypothetical protein